MTPKRWQRSRAKGAKQPPNTKYCGRGTIYGNNWIVGQFYAGEDVGLRNGCIMTNERAVAMYAQGLSLQAVENGFASEDDFLRPLLDYDYLSCFCGLDETCHVDVIIERLSRLTTGPGAEPESSQEGLLS